MASTAENESFHEGKWLKKLVARTGQTQQEFADKAGMKKGTLVNWFLQSTVLMAENQKARFLRALSMPESEFEAKRTAARREVASPPFDNNVPVARRFYAEIPLFDLSVSAGPWTDVAEVGEVIYEAISLQGLFRIRLAGDSMAPTYKSGDIVEFEMLREGLHFLEAGRDYYVHRSDDTATFKRLIRIEESSLYFKALNAKKYPDEMHANREDVVRMAVAKGVFTPVG